MHDFALPSTQRKLFHLIEADTVPYDDNNYLITENSNLIYETIRHLHQHLYGHIDETEVQFSYDLFIDLWSQGIDLINNDIESIYLPTKLANHPITYEYQNNLLYEDRQYTIRAWGALLSYLINDYQFLYE